MFTNGIVSEIEVDNLNDVESVIRNKYGLNRKFTVLNVQFCKERGEYMHGANKYDTHHYYKVFFMVGPTHEQTRRNKEDREQLRREREKERKNTEAEEAYTNSLSDSELATYKKEKRDKIERELAVSKAREEERTSISYLKKKLEEAKEKANNLKTPNIDRLLGKK